MHGGHADVAMRLGWKMMSKSRKPPGYWDSLPNVLREVTAFCEDQVHRAARLRALQIRFAPLLHMWRVQFVHVHVRCTTEDIASASVIVLMCHSRLPWCAQTLHACLHS